MLVRVETEHAGQHPSSQEMPVLTTLEVRPMRQHDLAAIMQIQAQCYPPSMQEGEEVVLSRMRVAGDTSFVASDMGLVRAYVFGYPSLMGKATPLGNRFTVPANPDTLYIHDLSVSPAASGQGLARALIDSIVGCARERRLSNLALVSVQDSQAFWERLGFEVEHAPGREMRAALATYPGSAVYMTASCWSEA